MADARQIGKEFVEAFNAHDEQAMRRLNGENVVFEAPGDVRIEGREAATQYAITWQRAFSDARLDVQNQLECGDWVVQEFVFRGTHDGTLAGPAGDIPPTNRSLAGRGVQIFLVEDGVVTKTRLYYDQVQVMTQLGLMPELSAATG